MGHGGVGGARERHEGARGVPGRGMGGAGWGMWGHGGALRGIEKDQFSIRNGVGD